jgi:hypothetical protein
MPIKVSLVPDRFGRKGMQVPRIGHLETAETDQLLEMMTHGSALRPPDLEAAMKLMTRSILFFLSEGHKVITPLGTFSPGYSFRRSL